VTLSELLGAGLMIAGPFVSWQIFCIGAALIGASIGLRWAERKLNGRS
jgi:hypothetical protein